MSVTIDNVLNASLGEVNNRVVVRFKKTVYIKEYETEVTEGEIEAIFDRPLNGCERMLCSAILRIQLEYEVYVKMYIEGKVTELDFNEKKQILEVDINALKSKAETILGKSTDYLFSSCIEKKQSIN